jgi:hypothetical protein
MQVNYFILLFTGLFLIGTYNQLQIYSKERAGIQI